MSPLLNFAAQIVVYGSGPFLCMALKRPSRTVALYVYLGIVLFISGFAGALFALPLAPGIAVSGGNIAYGGFLMATIALVITERDFGIFRTVTLLIIVMNIFHALLYLLYAQALADPHAINPLLTRPELFSFSVETLAIGGGLIILELLILLATYERIKRQTHSVLLLAVLYTGLFFLMLVLDGIAFPLLAFRNSARLGETITGGLAGKGIMGASYSLILFVFLIVFRDHLIRFAEDHLPLRDLLQPPDKLAERAYQSETNYRALVETAHDLIWALDVQGRITFINPASHRIFGREPEAMIGQPFTDFVAQDALPTRYQLFTSVLENDDRVRNFENWVVHRDGHHVLLNANAKLVRDPYGHVIGAMGTSQDITERKQAELQLRASEARYRQLYESASVAISEQNFSEMTLYLAEVRREAGPKADMAAYLLTHPQHVAEALARVRITAANHVAVEMYGLGSEDELRNQFTLLLDPANEAGLRTQAHSLAAVEARQPSFEGEFLNQRAGGERFELLLRWVVLPDSESTFERVLVTATDVSPLKRAQAEIVSALEREHAARIQSETLRKTAETLVRMSDIGESLRQASLSLHEQVAFDSLTVHTVEQNQLRLVIRHDAHGAARVEGTATVTDYAAYVPLRDLLSRPIPLRRAAASGADELARRLGLAGNMQDWLMVPLISRDITVGLLAVGMAAGHLNEADCNTVIAFSAQISLAIDSARTKRDLELSYQQLQQAQASLIQAARLSTIGELAAGVAHQINNPLTTVIADSYLILQHVPPGSPERESAEAINRAAYKAGQIVQRLLDFARATPSHKALVPVNQSIQQAVDIVRAQIEPRYATLQLELAPDLPPVFASDDHLQDVWMNLLLNARDAVRDTPAGIIRIETAFVPQGSSADLRLDGQVEVRVSDNGTGIPPETLPRIFVPFFTTKKTGTGLGLSVCAEIIRQHQGTISVESTVGEGSTFLVLLPAHVAEGALSAGEEYAPGDDRPIRPRARDLLPDATNGAGAHGAAEWTARDNAP